MGRLLANSRSGSRSDGRWQAGWKRIVERSKVGLTAGYFRTAQLCLPDSIRHWRVGRTGLNSCWSVGGSGAQMSSQLGLECAGGRQSRIISAAGLVAFVELHNDQRRNLC